MAKDKKYEAKKKALMNRKKDADKSMSNRKKLMKATIIAPPNKLQEAAEKLAEHAPMMEKMAEMAGKMNKGKKEATERGNLSDKDIERAKDKKNKYEYGGYSKADEIMKARSAYRHGGKKYEDGGYGDDEKRKKFEEERKKHKEKSFFERMFDKKGKYDIGKLPKKRR